MRCPKITTKPAGEWCTLLEIYLNLSGIAPAGEVGMTAAIKGPQPVFLKLLVANSAY